MTKNSDPARWLAGGGEMGERIRAHDWSKTPLGAAETWPQSLRSTVSMLLPSKAQIVLFWGAEFVVLYNDAYRPVFGAKHPDALGRPGREAWSEIWDSQLHALFQGVVDTGDAFSARDLLFVLDRNGFLEETYFDVSYDPVRVESGLVGGVFCIVTETTERVVGERRLALLRDLAAQNATARTEREACILAMDALEGRPDVAFALAYVGDHLHASTFHAAERRAETTEDLVKTLALPSSGDGHTGRLIVGINPRRPFDDGYRSFLHLVADQVSTALTNARAYEAERRRVDALAELDRAKTAFFSNISHEFRTPLTLMLGPLEEWLSSAPSELPAARRQGLQVVHRNALRLQKLVNSLLDFSRIEAGRIDASYEPVDLASFTAELASVFRSAIEATGLKLTIDCPALPGVIYVDRDMWEKVVLNLVSNALKFTFEGEILVKLTQEGGTAILSVSDSGIGISAADLPRVFDRFHRVRGARSRTHEGTGIGLALVHELVRLHGGTVAVESIVDVGTTFRVSLPAGFAHLPADRVQPARALPATVAGASAFVNETAGWLTDGRVERERAAPAASGERERIVLADDNADMRQYVQRLLGARWNVEAYSDGKSAWDAIRAGRPNLVLADVMMPGLDGFELVRAVRSHEDTRNVPVVLLSARAGEESRTEGMESGANDYLVKPFSARELVARVGAHLELARVRREAEQTLRESEGRYRLLVEQSADGIFLADRQGRYLDVNQAACELLGMTRAEVLSSTFLDVLVPEEHHRIAAELARMDDGSVVRGEWRFRRKDGAVFVGEIVGRRLPDGHLQGLVRDITERRRAEQRQTLLSEITTQLVGLASIGDTLEQLGARIGGFYGLTHCVFAELTGDLETGHVFHGWSADGVPSLKGTYRLRDFLADEALAALLAGHPAIVTDTERDSRVDATDYAALGIRSIAIVPLLHDGACRLLLGAIDNKPRAWRPDDVDLIREVTNRIWARLERERADAALRASQDQLKEADRRKDEFLAVLAHELRNPLGPIRTGLELIRLAGNSATAVEHVRAVLERQVSHMVRLIDDLMDVSRITSGKIRLRREPTAVADIVGMAVDANRDAIQSAGIELDVHVPEEPCVVDVDPTRMVQVLSNLLHNALKFTPSGGRIEVSARSVAGRTPEAEGELELTVTDTGVGISEELLPRVFDLFAQGDSGGDGAQPGLGIGLALARRLVEMHGGRISAASAGPDQGSTMTVRLATSRESPADNSTPRAPAEPIRSRVLVVDDNVDAAQTLAWLITALGGEACVAHDGQAGLQSVRDFRPDTVLLDVGMPGLDGYETCRRLRQQSFGSDLLIVALTGWGQEQDKQRAFAAGFDAHLTKPADPAVLKRILRSPSRLRT